MAEDKTSKKLYLMLGLSFSYILIGILWYTFNWTLPALIIFVLVWTIAIMVSIGIVYLRKKDAESESIRSEKIELLSPETCLQQMGLALLDQGIKPENITQTREYIIKPEDPSQAATQFFVRTFQCKFYHDYLLQYINRQTAVKGLISQFKPFNELDIREVLEGSSESTREYSYTKRQYYDTEKQTPVVEVTTGVLPKFNLSKKEQEDIIKE